VRHRDRPSPVGPPPFARLMGIVPLGIGITVIAFLWGAPFGEFGSPPLFFRFFGSFIAPAFVMVGVGILFGGTMKGRSRIFDRLADGARQQADQGCYSRRTST